MDATKILPRMYVIGSDGECVGMVDRVADSRIQLASSNSTSRGQQISLASAHSVEGDRVWLVCPSYEVLATAGADRGNDRRRGRSL